MLKKTLMAIALTLSAASGSASASILDDLSLQITSISPAKALRSLAENPSDEQAALKLRQIIADSSSGARRVFAAWQGEEEQSLYPQWPEVGLNLLRWIEPGHTYDWKNGVRLPGGQVSYQQDSLVDLERTQAIHQTFEAVQEEGRGYLVHDGSKPQHAAPSTSERLLSEGYAPIAPDNKPVIVCRLGDSSQAPYVEMSMGQRDRFQAATGLAFNACLSGSVAQSYWKGRYGDFVDGYYDRTKRLHPGETY